jgi:hypothetical protein
MDQREVDSNSHVAATSRAISGAVARGALLLKYAEVCVFGFSSSGWFRICQGEV